MHDPSVRPAHQLGRVVPPPQRDERGQSSHPGTTDPNRVGPGHPVGAGGGHDAIPCPVAPPPGVAVIDRLMRAIACGNIRPRRSGMQAPKDAIDDWAMGTPRGADLALIRRQFGFKEGILGISQIVASHGNRLDYGKHPSVYHIRDRIVRDSLTRPTLVF